jgi:outer membrane receptor protein involved in Fe transport
VRYKFWRADVSSLWGFPFRFAKEAYMYHRFMGKRLLLPLLLIVLVILPCALAQETTAGLQGTVKDSSGAVVPAATVEVSGPALIGTRTVQTDSSGNYRFSALPPGVYSLAVSATGFRTTKETGIDLSAGRLPNIDVVLQVGAVAETIEVTSQAPAVDVTQSKVAVTVDQHTLVDLPKGRSYQSVIQFAPGARQEPLQSTTGAQTNGFQIDGASDSENVYLIDGVNTTNIQNGGVGKDFQMDFIEEVQVKSSSFEAEFGGALGGVINAVPKRGSNTWHGSVFTYLRSKVWLFASYIPTLQDTRRTTTFTGLNPGPRQLTQSFTQHNAYNRLDWGPLNSLRLFASWNYGYSRTQGTLSTADSPFGQRNTAASTDPNTLRADNGSVNPLSIYTYGADWTPTSRLAISARYGYFFNNNEQRGIPSGTRYVYQNTVNATNKDLAGNPFPASSFNTAGFANIPSNLATAFDAYKRDGMNIDASYFTHFLGGTHTFKAGFFWSRQSNDVLRTFNGGAVNVFFGTSYQPQTSTTACDGIIAQNVAAYGAAAANAAGCTGKYGYFVVGTNVVNTGGVTQTAKAFYFQDAWSVGHGLTLNLGLRFDQETQPPFDPKRFPTVDFGWGDKIAPRLGAAYDLLHNGKVKIYASYGKFYDIMKLGLARGSFGSDYWHNCVYAMDDTNYSAITPSYPVGGGCPATGPAPGVSVGRFIENVDYRATKADPRDPAISPSMKPMLMHEFVTGVDWAISSNWSLETRYSRKRLDRTIEDMSITDNLGFYIGNPGTPFADVLHRPVSIPCPGTGCTPDASGNYLTSVPFCAECPPVVGASRRFDGLEFRLVRRPTSKWLMAITYDYSKLRGNYAGLTNTDPTDGTSGRHSPNNGRAFDLPTMTYIPSGKIDDGPLSTDRPNTAKFFGSYTQKWFGGATTLGVSQIGYQGTPINSCLPVVGTSSACQWAEGRGNFATLTRSANGDIVKSGVVNDARTDVLLQTDVTLRHEIRTGESKSIGFEMNVFNLFNQRAGVNYYEFAIPTNLISPSRASRFPGDPQVDWGKVMSAYNYVDALNGTGAFGGGVQPRLTLASRYGLPQIFQQARNLRIAVKFTF